MRSRHRNQDDVYTERGKAIYGIVDREEESREWGRWRTGKKSQKEKMKNPTDHYLVLMCNSKLYVYPVHFTRR